MLSRPDDFGVFLGAATVLVNIGDVPLVLTGTIERITTLELCGRKHSDPDIVAIPGPVKVTGEIEEEEEFLIIHVTTAILPPEFPLSKAQLEGENVAVNLDYVILVFPVGGLGVTTNS